MKKLLSILAALGLTATASTMVVACGQTSQNEKLSFKNIAINYGYITNDTKIENAKGHVLTVYGTNLLSIEKDIDKSIIVDSKNKEVNEKFTWLTRDMMKSNESTDTVAYIWLSIAITNPGTYSFNYEGTKAKFVIPDVSPKFTRITSSDDNKTLTILGENLYLVDAKDLKIVALDPSDETAGSITFSTKNGTTSESLILLASKALEKNTKYVMEWSPNGQEPVGLPAFQTNSEVVKYNLTIDKGNNGGYDPDSILSDSHDSKISGVDVYVKDYQEANGKDLWTQVEVNNKQSIVAQVQGNLMHVEFANTGIKEGTNISLIFTGENGSKQEITISYNPEG